MTVQKKEILIGFGNNHFEGVFGEGSINRKTSK